MYFRPFMKTPEVCEVPGWIKLTRHPVFAWLRLRPVIAQHTRAEHEALKHWASGRSQLVELGVAEGGSACALAEGMAPTGTLTLIDPFHLSRWKSINATRRAAHAAVSRRAQGGVAWIEEMSSTALPTWNSSIDFLMIDGDHHEDAVLQDWSGWSPFVAPGGLVVFHDARVFPDGWPQHSDGPVRVVDQLFRGSNPLPGWEILQEVHSLVAVRRER